LLARVEIVVDSESNAPDLVQTLRDGLDDPARIDDLPSLPLRESDAPTVLRELLRYWVTHTRPNLDLLHHPVRRLLDQIEVDPTATADAARLESQITTFIEALETYLTESNPDALTLEAGVIAPLTPAEGTALRRAILQRWAREPAACKATEDDCLLLAAVQFNLTETGTAEATTLTVENLQRPYLLHTRLLQELLLRNLLQSTDREPVLGIGEARYADTAGPTAPVTPVNPLPEGTNVAFNVSVPNPTLGIGDARYQVAGEDTGVIPIESLPPGNVAFNVVMPPPPTPSFGIGNVTLAAPGTRTGVFPTTAAGETTFNVVIPFSGGSDRPIAPPHDQVIIRPSEMMAIRNAAATAGFNGYPAMRFQQGGVVTFSTLRPGNLPTGFSDTPRFFLRLYCAADELSASPQIITWQIFWRWLRAIGPTIEDEPFREFPGLRSEASPDPEAELVSLRLQDFNNFPPDSPPFEVPINEAGHLHISPPFEITPQSGNPAEYLVVYLMPQNFPQNLFLLMAELRWEV